MGKSCGQLDFFSLGGQYYSLGQSIIYSLRASALKMGNLFWGIDRAAVTLC